ncbi:DUF58 domain-containing protein [Conexibacter sp. DBS9H8]|uniref:DUF58 domain-containing protein n=1 Tax=Conexibacter sp. DBS9H8 TaxID=2937801 RepID=UPI00200E36DD|nr:DUF58 domain-containing protein [Conexibacter sp. DBS9H8]
MSDPPAWGFSAGPAAQAATALLIAAIGLLTGRVDIALLSLPLTVAAALTRARRRLPAGGDAIDLEIEATPDGRLTYRLAITAPPGADAAILQCRIAGGPVRTCAIACPVGAPVTGTVSARHSGPQEPIAVDCQFLWTGGLLGPLPAAPVSARRAIAPARRPLGRLPLPRRLAGTVGGHDSIRPGSGGEFRDIHPYGPGERLRRIDWKASARHGQNAGDLYVRRSHAEADATVMIVIDSRDDVSERLAEWGSEGPAPEGISSLDLAREAAASLAEAYIGAGDRVGLRDLSSHRRMVGHSGGRQHLWRLLRTIELTAAVDTEGRRALTPTIPPGALVYLLSTVLDDEMLPLALTWAANGHRVILIDTLPPAREEGSRRSERIAHRIVMMERADRLATLAAGGVQRLAWSEPDGLPLSARLALLGRPPRRLASAEVTR